MGIATVQSRSAPDSVIYNLAIFLNGWFTGVHSMDEAHVDRLKRYLTNILFQHIYVLPKEKEKSHKIQKLETFR